MFLLYEKPVKWFAAECCISDRNQSIDFPKKEADCFPASEAVIRKCSVNKVFLKIAQNSQENACAKISSLIKLQASECNFIKKETLAQVFSCRFYKISKNTFSYRTYRVAASVAHGSIC